MKRQGNDFARVITGRRQTADEGVRGRTTAAAFRGIQFEQRNLLRTALGGKYCGCADCR